MFKKVGRSVFVGIRVALQAVASRTSTIYRSNLKVRTLARVWAGATRWIVVLGSGRILVLRFQTIYGNSWPRKVGIIVLAVVQQCVVNMQNVSQCVANWVAQVIKEDR